MSDTGRTREPHDAPVDGSGARSGEGPVRRADRHTTREALATLRGRVTRGTSAGLALLTLLLVVVVVVRTPAGQPRWTVPVLIGVLAVVYHLAVAALPWERWARSEGEAWRTALHLAISITLVGVGMAITSPEVAVALLWMFTLTTAQASATRGSVGQVVTYGATVVVAVLGAAATEGVAVTELVVALSALGALALLFGTASRTYAQAVARQSQARAEADAAADRALALGRASRALVDDEPPAVLEAIVTTTERLGYPYTGVYAHDAEARELHYVAARGLSPELRGARFPDDVGVAGMVLAEGATVVLDDYPDHPKANPAFTDLLCTAIGTPIRGRDGTMTGVLVCGRSDDDEVTDIDRQVFELLAAHAGRALELAEGLRAERRRVAELAELDRLKSDFLATVSHELRTPLTVVCGLSQTLADRWTQLDDELKRSLLDRVRANAQALDDVIATLLDFGQLEAGRLQPAEVTFDLSEVVAATVSRLEPMLADHQLALEVVPGVHVHGDPRLLERVVENLLSNAARHTEAGTRVVVCVRVEDEHVRVEVSDAGGGIPAHELLRIGERFFRGGSHETRQTRGMGLGLALAREVLQLHGSDLDISSEVGEGAVFAFRLERAADHVRPQA